MVANRTAHQKQAKRGPRHSREEGSRSVLIQRSATSLARARGKETLEGEAALPSCHDTCCFGLASRELGKLCGGPIALVPQKLQEASGQRTKPCHTNSFSMLQSTRSPTFEWSQTRNAQVLASTLNFAIRQHCTPTKKDRSSPSSCIALPL